MSIWGRLWGTDEALNTTVTGISNALDVMVYTDEEKATDAAAGKVKAQQLIIDWIKASSGQNLARRLLAIIITSVWLLQYMTAMFLNLVAVWASDPDKWQESATLIGNYADGMTGAMMLILGFYFAAPHMDSIATAALQRFGAKPNG